ncbi:zinc-dependent alcohol dehydrogenase [Xenorhabdus siamensis]|uniref:zinc-dependent alcohol dehydrogenase n=1 Tax=Xenorhabdus siamensis TaxID=3136254 RepID=UPI0030F37E38
MYYSLVCTGIGKQQYKLEKIKKLKESFVLVEVIKATICGSDYMVLHGIHPYKKYPAILGHEFIGKIIDANDTEFNINDMVTSLSYGYCGKCDQCKKEYFNHCVKKITYNTFGSSGAFTKHMIVHRNSLLTLPKAQDNQLFVISEPLSIVVHAFNKIKINKSSRLLIIGAGAMGLLSAIYYSEYTDGSNLIIVEHDKSRRKFAQDMGFEVISDINTVPSDYFNILIVAGGNKFDINKAMKIITNNSLLVLISYFDANNEIDMNTIVKKEITIKGSFLSSKIDLLDSINILYKSLNNNSLFNKIITNEIKFSELEEYMGKHISNGKVLIDSLGVL